MKSLNSLIMGGIGLLLLINSGCSMESNNSVISSDNVKISFKVQGMGKPALVLIHGWANNRSIWDSQLVHFSEKYKVVVIDLPGFGQSGNNRKKWTIASFGQDVAAVIRKLKLEQTVLVGFSMGGPIAIETAGSIPEFVVRIVLVDNLHDVEMNYPPEIISHIDSFFMNLVTNPTNEKLVDGGF